MRVRLAELDAAPFRGRSGPKRYSARQPSRVTCHGTPASARPSCTPAVQRSATEIIRTKASSVHAAGNFGLERYLHLYALDRGILLTPFHNMALMSPATTGADVDRHTEVFREAVLELAATVLR